VFPFVDAGARTAVVEALVENTGRRFLPGQYVMMEFVTGERAEALSVPRGAVARLGGKSTVWVVKDGRAEPMEVATGLENPERIEVTKGLAGGEKVIARGHEGLYAGARVSPVGEGMKGMEGTTGPGAAPAKPKEGGHGTGH
jgi:hypothetical protein